MRNSFNILIGKPEVKRPLGRQRHKWEDAVKMDLKEIVCKDVHWRHLARDMTSIRLL
jgi:hypothetical protein